MMMRGLLRVILYLLNHANNIVRYYYCREGSRSRVRLSKYLHIIITTIILLITTLARRRSEEDHLILSLLLLAVSRKGYVIDGDHPQWFHFNGAGGSRGC